MTENILLAVYPKIWKPFLCGVQYLGQVTKGTLLVKDLISLTELFAIGTGCTVCFKHLAKSL
jgi:hypothetical protein